MTKYYVVEFTATGHGSAMIEATSQEEAEEKARSRDTVLGSDELHEWEIDRIMGVTFDYEEDADD